jgi:hypothetical protein
VGLHAVRFIYQCEASGSLGVTEVDGSVDKVGWFAPDELAVAATVELVRVGIGIVRH